MAVISIIASQPAWETSTFHARSTKYCFVVIVFNEGKRLVDQLTRMSACAKLADIIIAERRSNDGSTAPEVLKPLGVRCLLTTDMPGGATAIRMAFSYALQEGYEGIILVDGNGKDGVEALPNFIEKLESGYDFVQGSRFMRGGFHKNTPLLRSVGIRLVMNPLLWFASGFLYSDGLNGFRGYSREFLLDERVKPFRDCFVNFNLQYYLSMRAPELGFKTVEIPVSRVYPDDGSIPTKVTGIRRNVIALVEMFKTVAGAYNP
jgi:dolichol-phosphate mannosyltransferase